MGSMTTVTLGVALGGPGGGRMRPRPFSRATMASVEVGRAVMRAPVALPPAGACAAAAAGAAAGAAEIPAR